MIPPPSRHQREIQHNRLAWERKPLLGQIYSQFYAEILAWIDLTLPGRIIEIGSGIGNLKRCLPQALATDLSLNPWLDVLCDTYELPFARASVSHLILFDVFHHLQRPQAMLDEAARVLRAEGRLLLFEPFISVASFPVYGAFHPEPIGWRSPIDLGGAPPSRPRPYYAAQGNATRLFFHRPPDRWPPGWEVLNRKVLAGFSYLLSGGFSRPAFYPAAWLGRLQGWDRRLSRWPRWFGARCLVVLRRR